MTLSVCILWFWEIITPLYITLPSIFLTHTKQLSVLHQPSFSNPWILASPKGSPLLFHLFAIYWITSASNKYVFALKTDLCQNSRSSIDFMCLFWKEQSLFVLFPYQMGNINLTGLTGFIWGIGTCKGQTLSSQITTLLYICQYCFFLLRYRFLNSVHYIVE